MKKHLPNWFKRLFRIYPYIVSTKKYLSDGAVLTHTHVKLCSKRKAIKKYKKYGYND